MARGIEYWRGRARGARARGERDYRAEYQVRVRSAAGRGLTKAEARGHAEESRTGVDASTWRALDRAAAQAIDCYLAEGPFGPGNTWSIVYVWTDREGEEHVLDITKGKRMRDRERDDLKERIKRRLAGKELCVPAIGTP